MAPPHRANTRPILSSHGLHPELDRVIKPHPVGPSTSSDVIKGSRRDLPSTTIKSDLGVFSTRTHIRCARTSIADPYGTGSWAPGHSSPTQRLIFSLAQKIKTFCPWIGRKGLRTGEGSGSVESWPMNRQSNAPAHREVDGEDLGMSPIYPSSSSISAGLPNWSRRGRINWRPRMTPSRRMDDEFSRYVVKSCNLAHPPAH